MPVKSRIISGGPLFPALPTRIGRVTALANNAPTVVRWCFLLFVFTIPLEAVDLGFMSGSFSPAKLSGLLFAAVYFFHYNPLIHKKLFPSTCPAMFWFALFAVILGANAFVTSADFLREFFLTFSTLIMLLIFFRIAVGLLREKEIAKNALLAYSFASALLSAAMIFRVSGISHIDVMAGNVERESALGENPNKLGIIMVLAVVAMTGLLAQKTVHSRRIKIALLVSIPVLVGASISTGSRGGLASLIVGIVFLLGPLMKIRGKSGSAICGLFAITAIFLYFIIHNPASLLARLEGTYYEGNDLSRIEIFETSLAMISEKPLFGWGPKEFMYELGRRINGPWTGGELDSHNLFLYSFVAVGAFGAIPFLVGLWSCLRSAWVGRTGNLGTLPLGMLLALLTANLSGNWLFFKITWFVFALSMAVTKK